MSLAADPQTFTPIYSVAELSYVLKATVEETFHWVQVRGEVSGTKRHTSGHLYFNLKDADAVLNAVCWRGVAGKLAIQPEDGIEVVCAGRLSTYPGRSSYQLVVERVTVAGQGALLALLEKRKQALAAEGLFDPARKRPLPLLPRVIGVVTSPTGAVIRDILHRITARFPCHVIVWPVAVQGEGAREQVTAALRGFAAVTPRPDIIIVARGGGSIEDLMPFNDEAVVRAVATCPIPVISAVGHETDVTLIDHAADVRAPTPTAAAELAVPVKAELAAGVMQLAARLQGGMQRRLDDLAYRLSILKPRHPRERVELAQQRLDDWDERLQRAMQQQLQAAAARLDMAGRLLDCHAYPAVLKRGFALVQDADGRPVTSAAAATREMVLRFHDGQVGVLLLP